MTREMQKSIKRAKEQAAILVRYANPRSKSKPTFEQVKEILSRHIPYCGGVVPAIVSVEISEFHRNSIIKSAYFIVTVENGKKYKISAYENLTGRTPEQKEADKTADFPSGLFRIFHDEIKEAKEEAKEEAKDVYEIDGLTICTGYRGMPGRRANNIGAYEEKARQIMSWENKIPFEEKQEQLEQLLHEFIKQA